MNVQLQVYLHLLGVNQEDMLSTTTYISRSRFANIPRLIPGMTTLCGQNSVTVQPTTEDKHSRVHIRTSKAKIRFTFGLNSP